jgi:hypothetical protein
LNFTTKFKTRYTIFREKLCEINCKVYNIRILGHFIQLWTNVERFCQWKFWVYVCPKLLAAETKLGYPKISFAVTWVYQNKNLSEELRNYYFICPNELWSN